MNMEEIIRRKRDGETLTAEEIRWFVKGYTDGEIPDYQASALLMAIYFQKLSKEETFVLTEAMRVSGDVVDLSAIPGIKVDKHSTGGVGDKTTLIVAPIAAACGVPVAKMSGRGLGFTGGTVDKLESIPGFQTTLSPEEFMSQVREVGIAVIGQSGHITPADKKLYALRDVTGTVENMSLIASSIMSKKLAAGSDAIVLDVKCGSGAFMKTAEDARVLGSLMCEIGENAGRRTIAMITDMSQPLGLAVGNALEVREAIQVLQGGGPPDIRELSLKLAGAMIWLGGRARTFEEGVMMSGQALSSGAALTKLQALIRRQGGDSSVTEDPDLLPLSQSKKEIRAAKTGYVHAIDAQAVGLASQHSGAGRAVKEDTIDPGAGILLACKVGDRVSKGDLLATVYAASRKKAEAAAAEAEHAFMLGTEKVPAIELLHDVIDRKQP